MSAPVQSYERRRQPPMVDPSKLATPDAPEAEEAVLGAVLADPAVVDSIASIVQPADFHSPARRIIFEALLALSRRGEPIDLVTVADELRTMERLVEVGGASYLSDLIERTPTAVVGPHYAKMVRHQALRREVIQRATVLAAAVAQDARPMADYVPELIAPLVSMPLAPADKKPLAQTVVDAVVSIEDAAKPGARPAVTTGFAGLDNAIGGWFPGSIIVAARTSVGKSSFVLASALRAALQGIRGAYLSLELPTELMAKRALANLAGVDLSKMLRGLLAADEMRRVHEAAEVLSRLPLVFLEDWQRSWPQVQVQVRRLVAEGAQFVVIDYLGLLDIPGMRAERRDRIGAISHDLKALANFLRVPIITPVQINREAMKEKDARPKLSNLRDSGDLEQDAGVVLLLHRPGLYDSTAPRDLCDVIIAKNSNGPCETVRLRFQHGPMSFEDWGPPVNDAFDF